MTKYSVSWSGQNPPEEHTMNLFTPAKHAKGNLVGIDGNAFALLGYFQRQAFRSEWRKEEVDKVLDEARARDYHHLVATLDEHLEPEYEDD